MPGELWASGDSVSESILPVKWKSGTQGKERSEGRIRECHARKTLRKPVNRDFGASGVPDKSGKPVSRTLRQVDDRVFSS